MRKRLLALFITLVLALTSCDFLQTLFPEDNPDVATGDEAFLEHDDIISTPLDDDLAFVEYNGNEPRFSEEDWRDGKHYIALSDLDSLGRVGVVQGLFDAESFPDGERGDIDSVYPTGFDGNNNEYPFVSANYIYNRCHMLGHQFSGLNDDERNLLTGTRFFNMEGNLPFENIVTDHMEEFDGNEKPLHHVLIRVTPDFHEDNLVVHGEIYEADCLECDDIDFAVYMFNKQPGVTIDYRTGENWANSDEAPVDPSTLPGATDYVYSRESDKFHLPSCRYAESMKEENRIDIKAPRDYMIDVLLLDPCGTCKP